MGVIGRVLGRLRPAERLAPVSLSLACGVVSVNFRRHPGARRMTLRLGRTPSEAVLTLPRRAGRAEALRFLDSSRAWLEARIGDRPAPVALAPGSALPLRGVPHRVVATGSLRGAITVDAAERTIQVPGENAHVPRRLADWLKREARGDLALASHRYAEAMGVSIRRIAVRDQKSRWGSCTASGNISYSWRLILAPPEVLDYVCAHEVAHRAQMDHSPRFWRLVLGHCAGARDAKQWLKRNGAELHRYGA